jgi:hypothetical protein
MERMMEYAYDDAALYITDPAALDAEGIAFAMPQTAGGATICYARKLRDVAWPEGATVLAQVDYVKGGDMAEELEATVRADADKLALWASVRSLDPVTDPETGETHAVVFWPAVIN